LDVIGPALELQGLAVEHTQVAPHSRATATRAAATGTTTSAWTITTDLAVVADVAVDGKIVAHQSGADGESHG